MDQQVINIVTSFYHWNDYADGNTATTFKF